MKNAITEIRRNSTLRAFERSRVIAAAAADAMEMRGDFLEAERVYYFFDQERRRVYPMESLAFEVALADATGLNRTEAEFKFVLEHLRVHAARTAEPSTLCRLTHFDIERNVMYVSRFDGTMYVLDGQTVDEKQNGEDGIFFLDDPTWQPFAVEPERMGESEGLFERMIVADVSLAAADAGAAQRMRRLLLAWLIAPLFSTLLPTRPVALMIGEKGSGKSTTLRLWLKALFGPAADVVGLTEKQDDLRVTFMNNRAVVLDNVDDVPPWLSDMIARCCTGMTIKVRKLYTTAEELTVRPNVWVAITTRTPKSLRRDDVLDRALALPLERRNEFQPEAELLADVNRSRNQLWADLLWMVHRILAVRPTLGLPPGNLPRMADWGSFLWLVASALGFADEYEHVIAEQARQQDDLLLEDDPLITVLLTWLKGQRNAGRSMLAKGLLDELGQVALRHNLAWTYREPKALAHRLKNIRSTLAKFVRFETRPGHGGFLTYMFWPLTGA